MYLRGCRLKREARCFCVCVRLRGLCIVSPSFRRISSLSSLVKHINRAVLFSPSAAKIFLLGPVEGPY